MSQQLDEFRTKLSDFAAKHRNEIRKNPEFRSHFQQMCARIGVDPLACKLIINTFMGPNKYFEEITLK